MLLAGIYAITNTLNGKRYIGSAVQFKQRWKKHRTMLRGGYHTCPRLQAAWNKYGEEAFRFDVLEVIPVWETLLLREQAWIDQQKPEYNHCPVAGSRLGTKASPDTRAKIGAAHKGRRLSDEAKARISAANTGKVRSAEARAKVSAARKGKPLSPEQVAKMRGRKLSEEHKAAIAAGLKAAGRKPPPCVFTPEIRAKISASLAGNQRAKGNKLSEETRAKMSAARMGNKNNLGNKASAETRAKLSSQRKGVPKSPEHAAKLRARLVAMNKARAEAKRAQKNGSA
jgi:group I intron endonuclease